MHKKSPRAARKPSCLLASRLGKVAPLRPRSGKPDVAPRPEITVFLEWLAMSNMSTDDMDVAR